MGITCSANMRFQATQRGSGQPRGISTARGSGVVAAGLTVAAVAKPQDGASNTVVRSGSERQADTASVKALRIALRSVTSQVTGENGGSASAGMRPTSSDG